MDYKEVVDSLTLKEPVIKNAFIAFLSGGVLGAISEILVSIFNTEVMLVFWIVIASFLTGLGIFDTIVEKFKMGVIIPITGFAHSVSSSSLEYKHEGLITGIGANFLKLAGSVILYGMVSSFIFSLIRWLICLV